MSLKEKYKDTTKVHKVVLDYITPRGTWYGYSWKGDSDKSGGKSNIGVHFFDMLSWVFGDVESFEVENGDLYSRGTIKLKM